MPLSCPLCPQGFSEFRDKETLDEHVCRVHGICTESARHQPKVVTTQVRLQHQGVIQQTANEQQQADGQPRAQMSHYQKKKLRFKKILCEICEQDSTTGKHFKVSACNACALFFRRTVRLNKRYNCVLGTGRVVLVLPDRFNPASFSWQKLKTWF